MSFDYVFQVVEWFDKTIQIWYVKIDKSIIIVAIKLFYGLLCNVLFIFNV